MNRRYTVYLTEQEMELLTYWLNPFYVNEGQGVMSYTMQDIVLLANMYSRFYAMLTTK